MEGDIIEIGMLIRCMEEDSLLGITREGVMESGIIIKYMLNYYCAT